MTSLRHVRFANSKAGQMRAWWVDPRPGTSPRGVTPAGRCSPPVRPLRPARQLPAGRWRPERLDAGTCCGLLTSSSTRLHPRIEMRRWFRGRQALKHVRFCILGAGPSGLALRRHRSTRGASRSCYSKRNPGGRALSLGNCGWSALGHRRGALSGRLPTARAGFPLRLYATGGMA